MAEQENGCAVQDPHDQPDNAPIITLSHVRKTFEDRQVLRDVSLTIGRGERVCFFGPSGCGKTTLVRLICGLTQPDSGSLLRAPGLRLSCHFQEDRLLPWYTARENLALTMPEDKVNAWLSRVGLTDAARLYPDEMSGGMRRRLSLARALGHESDVLVLDEPVRELDTVLSEQMLALIDTWTGQRTLLLVTHERRQAEALRCRMVDLPQ